MKKRQAQKDTQKELGSGGLGSLMEKPQHPGSSACLLYRIEQTGGRVIADS